uniref:Transposase n=1 Tax=Steinernema glaseri TaxID=37863 RepID=A0A1I7Y451_9BILA
MKQLDTGLATKTASKKRKSTRGPNHEPDNGPAHSK